MSDAIVNAVQSAPACEEHRGICFSCGTPREGAGYGYAARHAWHCHACARSVANAVLVAAREGDEWVRAVPSRYLGDIGECSASAIVRLADDELHRRVKEEA